MVKKIYGIGEFWANRTPALHLPGGRQLFVMTGSTLWTLDTATLQHRTLWKKNEDGGDGDNWSYLQDVQSSNQNVTTNKPTPSFLQAGCPFCHATNSVKALKAGMYESSIMIAFSTLTLQDGRHKRHLITKNIAWVMPEVCLRKTSGGPRMCGDWEKKMQIKQKPR